MLSIKNARKYMCREMNKANNALNSTLLKNKNYTIFTANWMRTIFNKFKKHRIVFGHLGKKRRIISNIDCLACIALRLFQETSQFVPGAKKAIGLNSVLKLKITMMIIPARLKYPK